MKKLKEHFSIIVIAVTSFLTHFIFFGYPSETVFDEVHFGKFISGYFNGQYFFDIHPPLAKLLITGVGFLGGYRPAIDFSIIGEHFVGTDFLWLRLLPTLAGAFLPIVIYYLCRSLNFSKLAAFLAGMLVILENSLLVQSRFILLDSLLLLFGFSSLLLYLLYQKHFGKKARYLLLGAIGCAAFAFSIKWTGGSFLALIAILECIRLFETKSELKEWVKKTCIFLGIPFVIYFLSFAIHFALLYKTGPGKDFMTPRFQKTLEGNTYEKNTAIAPIGVLGKFIELNTVMYRSNQGLTATHPYSSKWYTWPYMERPIYYWVQSQKPESPGALVAAGEQKTARIYLLGNPFIYWLGGLSALFFVFYLVFQAGKKKGALKQRRNLFVLLFFGFFLNLLPFIFIGRVMFLYHYFSSLVFSIMILSFLADEIQSLKIKKVTLTAAILISAITFVYFSPLTYGLPLSKSAVEARFWFKTWQ